MTPRESDAGQVLRSRHMADMDAIEALARLYPGIAMRQQLRTAACPAPQRLFDDGPRIADEQHIARARGGGDRRGVPQRQPLRRAIVADAHVVPNVAVAMRDHADFHPRRIAARAAIEIQRHPIPCGTALALHLYVPEHRRVVRSRHDRYPQGRIAPDGACRPYLPVRCARQADPAIRRI
ncbi:hypothetical protein WR25_17457 [Diploscapter pachys]|uniref:Uncharacterized protein n=1 Tax=Diploscapter pachys TaxID=2018661 RepID=A0A2A2M340_9BILA|nr:hypothetical protein WR25_17457 [Diploscapter pachys]